MGRSDEELEAVGMPEPATIKGHRISRIRLVDVRRPSEVLDDRESAGDPVALIHLPAGLGERLVEAVIRAELLEANDVDLPTLEIADDPTTIDPGRSLVEGHDPNPRTARGSCRQPL